MTGNSGSAVQALCDNFGIDVFTEAVLREHVSHDVFKRFKTAVQSRSSLQIDAALADAVAAGMKTWAVGRGATHYTHWFHPLTGIPASKHEGFLGRSDVTGKPLVQLSGEFLLRGEPDASSFPSGGMRDTSKARGYTIWDPNSPAFVRHFSSGSVLYIPTGYCSWTGESLDLKIPFLRSEESLSEAAGSALKLIECAFSSSEGQAFSSSEGRAFSSSEGQTRASSDDGYVYSTLGVEQEFFVIDRKAFVKRPDLVICGRTLIGAPAARGQELEDHYFASIPSRVADMLILAESRMWKLGIPIKTRHNEVAPAQYELAPVFGPSTVSIDQQNLTMAVLRDTGKECGFEVLFHEKPFQGVNGSGKHNNWSLSTSKSGVNLFDPSSDLLASPESCFSSKENVRFMYFLAAFVKAVDTYAGEIRLSIANHAQDLRLGANEAPPAIMSVYLGEALTRVVEAAIEVGWASGKERPYLGAATRSSASTTASLADHDYATTGASAPVVCVSAPIVSEAKPAFSDSASSKKVEASLDASKSLTLEFPRLPQVGKDFTDRNRTSPIAFTSNKFEFRAVGSSANCYVPCTALNAAVSNALREMNDRINSIDNCKAAIVSLIAKTLAVHKRVIFDGNGYQADWVVESAKRGLPNFATTAEALRKVDPTKMYTLSKVMTQHESHARVHTLAEMYVKNKLVEVNSLCDLVARYVIPSALDMLHKYSNCGIKSAAQNELETRIRRLDGSCRELQTLDSKLASVSDCVSQAEIVDDAFKRLYSGIRSDADWIESNVAASLWTLPTYHDMLLLNSE